MNDHTIITEIEAEEVKQACRNLSWSCITTGDTEIYTNGFYEAKFETGLDGIKYTLTNKLSRIRL
jgi:hypothetical protein